jgi:hypothetical protein
MGSGIYIRTEKAKSNMSLAHIGNTTGFYPGHSINNTGRTHFKNSKTEEEYKSTIKGDI